MQECYARNETPAHDIWPRLLSWMGHARQADTYRLRERLSAEHPFAGRRPCHCLLRGGAFSNHALNDGRPKEAKAAGPVLRKAGHENPTFRPGLPLWHTERHG